MTEERRSSDSTNSDKIEARGPRKGYLVVLLASTFFISYLHYTSIPALRSLHDIYRAFYYVPVMIAALLFGLRGSVAVYLSVLVSYVPYVCLSWTGNPIFEADRLLHLSLQGFLGVLAGFLIDRDRKLRGQLEKERYLAGLGSVAATIAHDLKNPLITIIGFVKRIQEGKAKNDTLQMVAEAAEDMQRIVHDVLDFSRPVKLDLKEEDIRNIVSRSCDFCRAQAEDRRIRLLCDIPDIPLVMAMDGFRMERALVNFISNAIEASREEQSVNISIIPGKSGPTIVIKDEGAGMDKETRENMFLPFFTNKTGGTGLGMPIAKKIIDAHKGKIIVSSKPGKGTEIRTDLPIALGKEKK